MFLKLWWHALQHEFSFKRTCSSLHVHPHPRDLFLTNIRAKQALKTLTSCKSMLGTCPDLQKAWENRSPVCITALVSEPRTMLSTMQKERETRHRNPFPPRNHSSVCAINVLIPWSQSSLCACPRKRPEMFCFLLAKAVFTFQNHLWRSQTLSDLKAYVMLRKQRQLK